MLASRRGVWHPLVIGTLAAASAWWAPSARAQTPSPKPLPCPRRWIYQPPPTTAYLRPLYVSDSAGDLFWWEYNTAAELVAVRDELVVTATLTATDARSGKTLWARQLWSIAVPARDSIPPPG